MHPLPFPSIHLFPTLLSLLTSTNPQSTSDFWNDYPLCSEICHEENFAASGCPLADSCLCTTVSWLETVAACIATNCPASQLSQSAYICQDACSGKGFTMAISPAQFIAAGEAALSTTAGTSALPTAVETPLASSTVISSEELTSAASSATSSTPATEALSTPATEALSTPATVVLSTSATVALSTSTTEAMSTPATETSLMPRASSATSGSSTASSVQSFTSAAPQATSSTCGGSDWDANPQNWAVAQVDMNLRNWWANNVTAEQKASNSFVELLAGLSGDENQQCGIGSQNCGPPSCDEFLDANIPRWVYFVRFAVSQMNQLFNNMDVGMTTAEVQMDPLIPDMAQLFPWQNPSSQLQTALPWIEATVTSVLSFVPFVGALFKLPDLALEALDAVGTSAGAFANAGLQTLQQDPVAVTLGDIQSLGVSTENSFKGARTLLDQWSTTVFNGVPDSNNKSIIDFVAGGRFNMGSAVSFPDSTVMAEFYFQMLVARFTNDQWRNNSNTFIMCANASSVPCREDSLFISGDRACCLYNINSTAQYSEPPGLGKLENATYGISASNITASSIASYVTAKFSYQDSDFYNALDNAILTDPASQAFVQGTAFQGIWTLAVCDVGAQSTWVADYTAQMMPCCCGPACGETEAFVAAANITGGTLQAFNALCEKQMAGYKAIGTADGFLRPPSVVLGLVLAAWIGWTMV
ncbi:hypothetical protein MMC17_001332 [Xylographa soralifera]|nr:hypothetical protein [Xylographa soralifera]